MLSEKDQNDIIKESQAKRTGYPGRISRGLVRRGRIRLQLIEKLGHFSKDCPQSKEPIKGRVFAMTHDQVDPDSAIVIGMISIVSLPANVLIDTGATHTFMSEKFMNKLGLVPDKSFLGFRISLPSGEELSSNKLVRNCRIQMQGHVLCADFIVLDMADFDVIFGMD
ncbi:uncharacterized protein [Henckelia pumila]|uniref:uncharacterized protein n=1 Tax=Henckelia pumila TaxID=405737 RepID=UPI003C6DBD24